MRTPANYVTAVVLAALAEGRDLVQKHEPSEATGWKGLLMRLDGLDGPDASTPREWRASFWNRKAARAAPRTALVWDPERMFLAHGRCVESGAREALRRSLSWLRP